MGKTENESFEEMLLNDSVDAEMEYEEDMQDIDDKDEHKKNVQVIDAKTRRKGRFVKRRKARIRSAKKRVLSESARKRKKEEEKEKLGASILKTRWQQYRALQERRKLQHAQ